MTGSSMRPATIATYAVAAAEGAASGIFASAGAAYATLAYASEAEVRGASYWIACHDEVTWQAYQLGKMLGEL